MRNHPPVGRQRLVSPRDLEEAVDGPGKELLGFDLDIGQLAAANFDPVAFLEKHHERVRTVHLTDRKTNHGPAVPLGQGVAPIREVLALLYDRQWSIPALVECAYAPGEPGREVRRALDQCQGLLPAATAANDRAVLRY